MSGLMAHEAFMGAALTQARLAFAAGEVPVGAVVVSQGRIVGQGHNRVHTLKDPRAHAEMLAIGQAAEALGNARLTGCTLYVTLEPCAMCAGAIVLARLEAVWYGAADPRLGCCGSVYRITEDPALGAHIPVYGGLLSADCGAVLNQFFQNCRQR